ncbi:MAG: YhcH/YjgK/YiaL family protein [Chitinophagales bacterium]|nr:YhcH/YjgK/YiaL family protein [Chitinophagales bacterium]
MIINHLKNIANYHSTYPHIGEAIDYISTNEFHLLKEGKNEFSENFYVVKIIGDKKSNFDGTLEVHREWIDIHIPLTDDEIIAFKEISECQKLDKEYDTENDYALYNESDISQLTLAKGYFCIIDTTICHMANLGEGKLEKLVFKIRK